MDWGIIAFIDALGFKGIWKTHEPRDVLASIEAVSLLATDLKTKINKAGGGDLWDNVTVQVHMFSDTAGIAVRLPPPKIESTDPEFYEGTRKYMLLRHVVMMLSELTGRAAIANVPLLYRGCISAGEFLCNETSFIGPAVDEAGKYFEACDGAFVFFSPSAEDVFTNRPWQLKIGHPAYFVPYSVPMKKGEPLKTLTVNPLLFLEQEERRTAIEKIIGCFENPVEQPDDVKTKTSNTKEYLEYLGGWQW
jgi:hypothetical protein